MDSDCENLKRLQKLAHIELFHLTEDELLRVLQHIKEITLYWRNKGNGDWGIEGITIQCTI